MGETWRVSVTFHGQSRARQRSCRKAFIRDLPDHLLDHVRVVPGQAGVILYADAADGAQEAQRLVQEVLARRNAAAAVRLEYWDAPGETWQEASGETWPDAPAPSAGAASQEWEARESRQRQDREQSMTTGLAAWQVRVDLPSHLDVAALAERLKSEGWPVAKRRKHLVAGANCEDDADGLAQEIEDYCGGDAVIRVERSVFGWSPADSIFPPGPSA